MLLLMRIEPGPLINLDFLFLHSKASDANIGIIAIFVQSVKNSNSE